MKTATGLNSHSSYLIFIFLLCLSFSHIHTSSLKTLLMDQVRFQEMQLELEQLTTVASVLLIVYNSAGESISGLPGLMDRLKNTVRVLLVERHTP